MNYVELSKEVSYALRHAPWEYELELDEEGWVGIEQLLYSLKISTKWKNITEDDLKEMIKLSSKKRHEIQQNRIRAFYGHSIPMKIVKKSVDPPKFLYHGTSRESAESILTNGLKPQQRQYVHLSEDVETAVTVGKRRDINPIVLIIDSQTARSNGIQFYMGNEKVWLSDEIPRQYINVINNEHYGYQRKKLP